MISIPTVAIASIIKCTRLGFDTVVVIVLISVASKISEPSEINENRNFKLL